MRAAALLRYFESHTLPGNDTTAPREDGRSNRRHRYLRDPRRKDRRAQAALTELVEFVEANEAEPIAYSIYIDEEGSRMTVMQIHPSSASVELHMRLAGPAFRKFPGFVVLSRGDIYGTPSDALLELMRQKTELLGNARVVVNELHAGFARFGSARPDDAARLDDGPDRNASLK